MNKVSLSGSVREQIGTKTASRLRREKRVPCVLYGGGSPVHFSVDEAALRKIVFTAEFNGVELDIDGTKTLAMVHEKQFQPVTDRVTHVDFMEIMEDREARVSLALRLSGQAPGVRKGGKLNQTMRRVTVKGLPAKFPSHIDVDISAMEINTSIHVSDLKLDGIEALEDPNDVVATLKVPKKVEEVAATAAAAVPGAPAAAGATPAAAGATPAAAPAKDEKAAAKK
jgi:large subunit ribosomal protein L25